MKRFWMHGVFALCTALVLGACGQAPPPLEQVEAELNAPTGTLNAKLVGQSYRTYTEGQVALQFEALSKYGQIPKFLEVTSDGKAHKVDTMETTLQKAGLPANITKLLLPYLPVQNDYRIKEHLYNNKDLSTITQEQILGLNCISGNAQGFGGGASFEGSIDLACFGEGSGRITVRGKAEGGNNSGQLSYEILLQNVCDRQGNCVDGGIRYRTYGASVGGFGQGSYLMSLYFRVKANGQEAEVKQGMRIAVDGAKQAGQVEVLTFLRDETTGREVSVVMSLEVQGTTASFSIRGANGTFSCQTQDAGVTGSCTATNGEDSITWSRN